MDPLLYTCDDSGIYFDDKDGKGYLVDDYPELIEKLTEICQKYFEKIGNKMGGKNE